MSSFTWDHLALPIGVLAVAVSLACAIIVLWRQTGTFDRTSATIMEATIIPDSAGSGDAFVSYQYQYKGKIFLGHGSIGLTPQHQFNVGDTLEIYVNARMPEMSFPGYPPRPFSWLVSCLVGFVGGIALIIDALKKNIIRTDRCT